jgi:aerobic-type carbon monoxide dehydrogenase small subunit (CoxS/CutS family)
MQASIRFRLNGESVTLQTDDGRMLLAALRNELALTGTKYGCGEGLCGACTVQVGGRAVHACTTSLRQVAGKDVRTIEGLSRGGKLHPLQQAFIDHGALQCGYCTPGMLLQAEALLRKNPQSSRAAIVASMEHNLCRCGAQQRIVQAIESAARQMGAAS